MDTQYRSHKELVNEAIADKDTSLILVMGETRSGKTKFINLVSDSNLLVGNGLRSSTRYIQLSRTYVDDENEKIILIDTPGLSNTARDDTEILQEVASFLADLHKKERKLQGIIYVQSLSAKWKTATSLRNFTLFSKLCGSAAMANVVVVTTVREDMAEEARSILEAQLSGPGWCLKQWIDENSDDEDSEDKQEDEGKNDVIPDDKSKDRHKAEGKSRDTTKNKVDDRHKDMKNNKVDNKNKDMSNNKVDNKNKDIAKNKTDDKNKMDDKNKYRNKVDDTSGNKGENKPENKHKDKPEHKDDSDSDDEDERRNTRLTVVSHKDQTTARSIIEQILWNDEMPLAIQTELCDDKKAFEETELGAFLRHGAPGMESILYEQEKQISYLTIEINKLRAELTGQKMGWGQMGYSDHSHAPYTYGYWGEGATSSQHGVPCNLCGEMTVGAIPICFECSNNISWYYHHSPEVYPVHSFANTTYPRAAHCPGHCSCSMACWQPKHCWCSPHPTHHVPPINPYNIPKHDASTSHRRFSTGGSTCAPDH